MTPGIYNDIADADYRAIDAVSQSTLKLFAKSAKAVQDSKEWPKHSEAFKLGQAADLLLFNPARFHKEFVEYGGSLLKDGETWTTERKGAGWKQFKEEYESAGLQILSTDELKEARAIAKACHQHQVAAGLLSGGESHAVFVWIDEHTGLKCKAQLDYWQLASARISDVKTTRSIEPKAWARDSYMFGYYVQAAFYIDGMSAVLDWAPDDITFTDIAVEKGAYRPDVVCYEVPPELIYHGRQQYRGWLEQYAKCKESGLWPGIAEDKAIYTQVPGWAQDAVTKSFVAYGAP